MWLLLPVCILLLAIWAYFIYIIFTRKGLKPVFTIATLIALIFVSTLSIVAVKTYLDKDIADVKSVRTE